jgi:hypothetical protein
MEPESLSGRLVVATPLLGDPNFRRTVILIVEDEPEEGTLGVVLNRPTEVQVGQVLESWTDLVTGPTVVFKGGPVSPNSALALALALGDDEPLGWRSLDGSSLMSRIGLVDLEAPPELLATPGGVQASCRQRSTRAPGTCCPASPPTRSWPSRNSSGLRCSGGRAAISRSWPPTRMIPCSTEPA